VDLKIVRRIVLDVIRRHHGHLNTGIGLEDIQLPDEHSIDVISPSVLQTRLLIRRQAGATVGEPIFTTLNLQEDKLPSKLKFTLTTYGSANTPNVIIAALFGNMGWGPCTTILVELMPDEPDWKCQTCEKLGHCFEEPLDTLRICKDCRE
jgi:hypothetical protein